MGTLSLVLLGISSAPAQQAQKLRVDGLIDGYYSWNQNHPFTGQNQWHLFDTNAGAWSLSLARLAIDRETDPVGFHVELVVCVRNIDGYTLGSWGSQSWLCPASAGNGESVLPLR